MKIVLFTHPEFLGSSSMPRYAQWIADGMRVRGHDVEIWTAMPRYFYCSKINFFKKWFGYVDQYIVFPKEIKKRLKKLSSKDSVLFVFTDHALGPWVPTVANKKHIIHCHDFLAQRSALGEIKENPTGFTGRLYQKYIRKGYQKGKNFISISQQTEQDLLKFLEPKKPKYSTVVYNGLNQRFEPRNVADCRMAFGKHLGINLSAGYLLHVGGNQWYKNRIGVIQLYNAWRKQSLQKLPLLLVGKKPNEQLTQAYLNSDYKEQIHFVINLNDTLLKKAYAGASVFLFPSLAEGFGWPIAEAMASGVPVITTNEKPMTEVGGEAALYIPKLELTSQVDFIEKGMLQLNRIILMSDEERNCIVQKGLKQAQKFDSEKALDLIELAYKKIGK